MIDFPATPTVGQVFTVGGQSWTWDGVKWLPTGLAGGPFVPLAGYAPAMNDNRIINGDMRIDQRNNGAATTPSAGVNYVIDRWFCNGPGSKLSFLRGGGGSGSAIYPLGYTNWLMASTATAYTPAATETFAISQKIEADMVSDFAFGSPNAQPVTLSFYASATLPGNYSGSLCNDVASRSYPFAFNLPTASTWTKFVITIPGDTAGTWVPTGNAAAVVLRFDLGSGANFRGVANAWVGANIAGVTGAVSLVANAGAALYLTGVKLEIGSIATPFRSKSPQESLADCQRYYQVGQAYMAGQSGSAGQSFSSGTMAPVALRGVVPGGAVLALTVTTNSSVNWTLSSANANPNGIFSVIGTSVASGGTVLNVVFNVNAEL